MRAQGAISGSFAVDHQSHLEDSRWRLGAIVFAAALAVQQLPLGRELVQSEFQYAEILHLAALERATTVGIENTYYAAVTWAVLYLCALIAIIRYGQLSFIHALRHQWPLTALVFCIPLSLLWTTNPLPVLMNSIHAGGVLVIAFAASMHYWSRPGVLMRHVAMVLGVLVLIHLGSVWFIPELTTSYDGRWQGLTTNPNTLGSMATLSVWANTSAMLLRSDWRRGVSWLLLGAGGLALYGSGSITALMAAIASVFVAVLIRYVPILARHALLLLVLILPAVYLVALMFSDVNQQNTISLLGRGSDLTGRTSQWMEALKLIEHHPWMGWGFDNNASVIEVTQLSTTHFHNGFLDLAVRGGIVAIILFLGAFVVMLRGCEKRHASFQLPALSFSSLLIITNVTEVSLLAPRNTIWLIFMLLAFSALRRRGRLVR